MLQAANFLTPIQDFGSSNFELSGGFPTLRDAKLAANRIESVEAPPWATLQAIDLSSNNLHKLHPDWFSGQVFQMNLLGNPALRATVARARQVCPTSTGGLFADLAGFRALPGDPAIQCTVPCNAGFFV